MSRRTMSAVLAAALSCACAGTSAVDDAAPSRRGPFPARSNGPLSSDFLVLRPRGAATAAPGALELRVQSAYSSIFEVGNGPAGSVSFDSEIWRTSTLLRTGIDGRTDVEVEIPIVYATSGFLDVFIEAWHAVLGLPDQGRETRPHFDYDMRITADGREAYALAGNEVGLGDVPIVVTRRVIDGRGSAPSVFVQGAVELPLGDEADGFGNGALDWGLGAGLESRLDDDWTLGGGLGWTDRVRPTSFVATGLEVDDGFALHADAEWRWLATSSLLLGLRYENAVSQSLGIEELGGDVLEVDVGVAIDGAGRSRWLLGFSDDALSQSGPDFTAMLGFQVAF